MVRLHTQPTASSRAGSFIVSAEPVLWAMAAAWVALNVVVAVSAPHADFFDAQVQLGAARDLLQGADPYTRYVQNPLWTLLLLTPFAVLPEAAAYPAHFAGMLVMWYAAALLLLRAAGTPWGASKTAIAAGVLVCYLPAMWSTHGQITGYHALGLALCLTWWWRAPLWAGAALALTAAKPHLGLVPTGALVVTAALSDGWRVPTGLAAATIAGLAATLGLRPQWLGQWTEAVLNPPPEVVMARAKYAPTVAHFAGRWLASEVAAALSLLVAGGAAVGLARWLGAAQPRLSPHAVVAVTVPSVFLITPYAQGYDLSLLAVSGALLAGAWFRVQGTHRRWLGGGLAGVYLFPYAMQLAGWPQATLLPSAAAMLVLALLCAGVMAPRDRGQA